MNLHRIEIIGRVVRDPDARVVGSGKTVLSFTVAVNDWIRDGNGEGREEASFYKVSLWDAAATRWQDKLHKGDLVFVEGTPTVREYQAKDGSTKFERGIKFAKILPVSYNRVSSPTAEPEETVEGAEDCPF